MPQLTYEDVPSVGLAGMFYGDPALNQIDSARNNAASDALIPFGVAVARDTLKRTLGELSPGNAKLPTASNDVIWGFALRAMTVEADADDGESIPNGDLFAVITQGKICVEVNGAFVAGGQVFIRHGGTGQKGSVLAADDSTNASLLANARFATSGADGDIGVVEMFGVIGAMS